MEKFDFGQAAKFYKEVETTKKSPKDQIEHCAMVWNKEWKMKIY